MKVHPQTGTTRHALNLAAVALSLFLSGCDAGPLKVGVQNWMPKSTGGPIETKPLPPASQVYSNYQQWLESETALKVRLYEAVLLGETNQLNYTVSVEKGDTPLGQSWSTFVTFTYRDGTNGEYQIHWHMRGRHKPDFLKLSGYPKKVLLQPFGTPGESPLPRLQIEAFEGVETRHSVVAEPGRKSR